MLPCATMCISHGAHIAVVGGDDDLLIDLKLYSMCSGVDVRDAERFELNGDMSGMHALRSKRSGSSWMPC